MLPLVPNPTIPEGVKGSIRERGLQILKVVSDSYFGKWVYSSEMKANGSPETEEKNPPL